MNKSFNESLLEAAKHSVWPDIKRGDDVMVSGVMGVVLKVIKEPKGNKVGTYKVRTVDRTYENITSAELEVPEIYYD